MLCDLVGLTYVFSLYHFIKMYSCISDYFISDFVRKIEVKLTQVNIKSLKLVIFLLLLS